MRLSDVVGALDMAVFPVVGLLMFVAVFVAVVIRVVRTSTSEINRQASIPLAGDLPADVAREIGVVGGAAARDEPRRGPEREGGAS